MEVIPEAYDAQGRLSVRPEFVRRKKRLSATFPLGRYVSQPLHTKCRDFEDMRKFLAGCKPVSDADQFGKDEYWQPPEMFEESRKGDCDDFAFWAWRQVMYMGFPARLVGGKAGRYGGGHAWVTFEKDGKTFLLEPLAWMFGTRMPRLSAIRHDPEFSVAWDGKKISFYTHKPRKFEPPLGTAIRLAIEWAWFYLWFWLKFVVKLPYSVTRLIWRRVRSASK